MCRAILAHYVLIKKIGRESRTAEDTNSVRKNTITGRTPLDARIQFPVEHLWTSGDEIETSPKSKRQVEKDAHAQQHR